MSVIERILTAIQQNPHVILQSQYRSQDSSGHGYTYHTLAVGKGHRQGEWEVDCIASDIKEEVTLTLKVHPDAQGQTLSLKYSEDGQRLTLTAVDFFKFNGEFVRREVHLFLPEGGNLYHRHKAAKYLSKVYSDYISEQIKNPF